jgi:hypothetical protein
MEIRNPSSSATSSKLTVAPIMSNGSVKCPAPAGFSNALEKIKKQKMDEEFLPKGHPMLRYALEMMSSGPLRSHVIGALVTDDEIQRHYYNHSVILGSEPLNFLENQSEFVAMLSAMSNLSQPQWAYIMPSDPKPLADDLFTFEGMELQLSNGKL